MAEYPIPFTGPMARAIYGSTPYAWYLNPWVWAVSFRRIAG